MIRKFFVAFGAVVLLLALASSVALAAGPDGAGASQAPVHRILGVVPAHGVVAQAPLALAPALRVRTNNLIYHNGPVMRTNTVYAIYWVPSGYTVSAKYQNIINGFFSNVGADNAKKSNVYYSDTQYYDTTGNIAYNSSVAGSYLDTNSFPANGCSDPDTSVCLSDAQLQTEVQRVMSVNSWKGGPTHLFFMFTPQNVGSCAGSACAFTYFCAYHSWIGSGSNVVLYANQPYASFVSAACDAGQHPNGDDADATINVVSHEHNEAITDEQGSAWYDRSGNENGDKCAWNFGTSLGGSNGSYYNQVINNAHYYLQQEWSNKSSGCVLQGQ